MVWVYIFKRTNYLFIVHCSLLAA